MIGQLGTMLLALTLAYAWPVDLPQAQSYAPGIVLVGYHASHADSGHAGDSRNLILTPDLDIRAVHVPIGQEYAARDMLSHDPRVAFAELDYAVHATDVLTPGDPGWSSQWAPAQIQAPSAWSVVTGTADVVIAVIDSGVQLNHEDLAAKVWVNSGETPGNGIDDDNNGKVDDVHGWHFYHYWSDGAFEPGEDANVQDDFGHGTHVSGIAAAATNNDLGIAGIAWGTRLMPVKVLDQFGTGWYSDIAAGIVYAADNGARIINLSLGGSPDSQTLRTAVDYARDHGVLVIAATGNDGGPVLYPAAYEPTLAVAATDANDQWASFSNHGPQVDLAAPGTDILSTWCHSDFLAGACLGSYYFAKSGTSMAAPHVSGVVALIWSRWPDLAASDVISRLRDTADDVGDLGPDPYTGWGRVNAYQAVTWTPPQPDLWIHLDAPAVGSLGEILTYTIRYGNYGGSDVHGVMITDTLPDGVVAAGPSSWDIGTVSGGTGPITLTLPVTVVVSGITLTNVVHIYPADGNAADSWQAETFIGIPPTAGFTISTTDVATHQVITFTNISTGTAPLTWSWDFGDGTAGIALNSPAHAYTAAGAYTVTLQAHNLFGSDSSSRLITVGAPALAGFSASAGAAKVNHVITFTNTSTGTAPLSYIWDFGDGLTDTLDSPTHAYTSPGTYTVSLSAANTYATSHAQRRMTIEPYQIYLPLLLP